MSYHKRTQSTSTHSSQRDSTMRLSVWLFLGIGVAVIVGMGIFSSYRSPDQLTSLAEKSPNSQVAAATQPHAASANLPMTASTTRRSVPTVIAGAESGTPDADPVSRADNLNYTAAVTPEQIDHEKQLMLESEGVVKRDGRAITAFKQDTGQDAWQATGTGNFVPRPVARSTPAVAGRPRNDGIQANFNGGEASWNSYDNPNSRALLEIGGANGSLSRQFEAGETPRINAAESSIPDGVYSYKITTLDPALEQDLALMEQARNTSDQALYSEISNRVQNGAYNHQTTSGYLRVDNQNVREYDITAMEAEQEVAAPLQEEDY